MGATFPMPRLGSLCCPVARMRGYHGTVPDIQYVPPGKAIRPSDQTLHGELEFLRMRRKLERVATFRNLQALSKTLESLVGRTLDDYKADKFGCTLRAVGKREYRYVAVVNGKSVAKLLDRDTNQSLDILSPDVLANGLPMVILGLDQCSVNLASQFFCNSKLLLCHSYFDKVHRQVKDIMKGLRKARNGRFLVAKLPRSYLGLYVRGHHPLPSGV